MQPRVKWNISVLKIKNQKPRILYPVELYFKSEIKKKTSNEQNWINSSPAEREMQNNVVTSSFREKENYIGTSIQ